MPRSFCHLAHPQAVPRAKSSRRGGCAGVAALCPLWPQTGTGQGITGMAPEQGLEKPQPPLAESWAALSTGSKYYFKKGKPNTTEQVKRTTFAEALLLAPSSAKNQLRKV